MRIKINFTKPFIFSFPIAVRISDINYGGHVGNDSILSLIHEARMAFFNQWNFTELNAGGVGLIMADSVIQYKGEAFHGDQLLIEIYVDNLSTIAFDLFYKISTVRDEKPIDIAFAKTGMVCYDYEKKSIAFLTPELNGKLD